MHIYREDRTCDFSAYEGRNNTTGNNQIECFTAVFHEHLAHL